MAFEHYIQSGGKRLRCGYTTGTCAALVAAGAAEALLTGQVPAILRLTTPKGLTVEVEPEICRMETDHALCAVRKDGGDDIDVTDGLLITARVERADTSGIAIDGGEGVGRVTKPGLDQPIGAAAINRIPRRMMTESVQAVCERVGYTGGLRVTISVPGGAEAASKTFNPRLGVEGGISILGTSGIVEPMSQRAMADTVVLELRQAAALGARRVILTPGNYGGDFIREQGLDCLDVPVVKCSNFIGDALDEAATLDFERVLLVGHIGKLVKLAGGIMNTHSRWGDCRKELFCAHAVLAGADRKICAALMETVTTDACIAILDRENLRRPVLTSLLCAIQEHLDHRAAGVFQVGAVLFSNEYGPLGQTAQAAEILREWKGE